MRWEELAKSRDAPDDVTGMVTQVSSAFVEAWNSTTRSELNRNEMRWDDSHGYVVLQCEEAGHPVEFLGLDRPLQPPDRD